MNTQKRTAYYDILKGYAIFLVALGHVIQSFHPDWKENIIILATCSFHMPLFMIVSGKFFLHSLQKTSERAFIVNKVHRLLIPSVSWGLINAIILGGGVFSKTLRN